MAELPPSTLPDQGSPARLQRAVTARAVLIGSLCAAVLCAILPYNDYILANTMLVGSYLPLAAVLAMFVLVVLINAPLHRYAARRALGTGELAVILTMLLVACSVPGQGLLRGFVPSLVAPFYYGQQNQTFWDAFVKMDLPLWLFPVESFETARASREVQEFYGRTPPGEAMPLAAWLVPMLGSGAFLIGIFLTLVSLAFLLRVQWGANERLAFPLAQLQLSLIESPAPGRALNALFRSPTFWIAAGLVFAIHSLSVLNDYFPRHITRIPLSYDLVGLLSDAPFDKLPWDIKRGTVFFTFVGVTYFIQSRVAFSLWSIWVITQFVTMQRRMVGENISLEAWQDQHMGACLIYVLGTIWLGRAFWWRVIRSFASRDPAVATERWAMAGVAAGVTLVAGWMMFVGAGLWMTLLAISVMLIAHLSTARVVAETGLPFIRTRIWPHQIYTLFPASSLGTRDVFLVGFATANGVYSNRESALTFTQHALRVDEGANVVPRETRRIVAVIAWTLLLAFAVGTVASLHAYYTWNNQVARGEPMLENKYGVQTMPEETIVKPVVNAAEKRFPNPQHRPWVHFTIGAGLTAVMQLLTWRLNWWPFVPVGYIFAGTWTFVSQAWFSLMIGWLAKVLILRFGGAAMFQRTRGIFVGLIVGEAMAAAVWMVINIILAAMGVDYYPVRFLPS